MNSTRFRIAAAVLVFGALALTLANPAAAFIRLARQADASSPVVQAHWFDSELPLNSVIDPTNTDISSTDALATVIQSAKNWENVNTSYFTVNPHQFGATDSLPKLSFDGQNSMFFDTPGANFAVGSGVIAFVRSVVDLSNGHTLDADLVFNDHEFFASISSPGLTPAPAGQTSVDLQAVLTHEYGHYFGLDHTSVAGATMVPFISNDISQRTLELDDQAGISTIFPESADRGLSADGVDFNATTGTISGTVLNGFNSAALFGAHVEAYNLAAPDAAHSISAISGELTLRNGQGEYTIHGLPPGTYAVRIVPLDGVNTIAADANIGGPYNGLDIGFEPEFWNGANESGNGFTDLANSFDPVTVNAAANTPGINFVTNTFPGRVIIAQHGSFENIVTFGNTGYLAVRFDPPFEGPYTISSVNFPSFTFNGVPAQFLSAKLCPMNPLTGGPDIANPLFSQAPYNGNPNGNNIVPLNIPVSTPNQTFFWVLQFPSQSVPGFPFNFPFLRMDFTGLDQGLFANSYRITLAGAVSVLIDRNLAVDMTCQLPNAADAPIVAPTGLGANRRATQTEFTYLPPSDKRSDGFALPHNSLDQVFLIQRSPFSYADRDTAGAGNTAMHLSPSPATTPATIWSSQALDKNGHRSLTSAVTILGLSEDVDEPNGRLNEAKVLPGTVTNRPETYSPAGDQDFYSLMAKPGDIIDASATATGQDGNNNTDLVMFLYDSNGDIVAFNDDFTGLNPRVVFTAPPNPGNSKNARKFTIQVTDFRSSGLTTPVPQVRVPSTYVLSASVTTPPAAAARIAGRTIDPDQFFFANSGPNPANPVAKFLFVIPRNAGNAAVRLNIFDVTGRLVRTLVDGKVMEAGPHTTLWDGRDVAGRTVASGTYFARMESGSWHQDARVTILK
ncbi:MAG TPA: matrixin family metalloprotease [Candidatus Binatia bacterium]|nr:matrixin family metalloprotease [Candidatus Binatia bacterium]